MDNNEISTKVRSYITADLMSQPKFPLKDNEPIITSGYIDSFALAELAVYIEDTFDVYIPNSELTVENMNTVHQIVDRILKG